MGFTGTGKNAGDRHPKVEGQVLIGAGTTVLGNITIGRGAQVNSPPMLPAPVLLTAFHERDWACLSHLQSA